MAGRGPISDAELSCGLDRIIKLCAENKITKDNAWDLNFITSMPDLIKKEAAAGYFTFHRASCVLDGGVRIYSKRVDSTYESMMITMQGPGHRGGA